MSKLPTRDISYLEDAIARMRHLEGAWAALYNIIAAYPAPDAPKGDLELHFLNAKSAMRASSPWSWRNSPARPPSATSPSTSSPACPASTPSTHNPKWP
ncbi:MAG: hypothetical protein HC888_14835 [Candidatus Competibacteraceae bacterium]|nr:hypothetical protein [Candidatus Competibacteraceae bacterium]